ncbi:hypothetical protein ACFY2W_27990 [Streptomyces sp. NPDC001262]|uniref:hypothetical protein n=1 Tax=Streptomyces sp. NPDC001262 TaxID=3364552 RepID=UPI0036964242
MSGLLCSVVVPTWVEDTAAGTVAFLLGLEPIPPHTDEKATQEYLGLGLLAGRIRMGATAAMDRRESLGMAP